MDRRWNAPLLLLAMAAASLSGCLRSSETNPGGLAGPDELGDAAPFTTFLCSDGFRLAADVGGGTLDLCNHRVTKPLRDGSRFEWVEQHGPANEVSIAVDPTNPLVVAGGAKDYTVSYISHDASCGAYTVWMGTYWSGDGGVTWGNDLMPGFAGDGRPSPLKGNLCNTDPVLAFDDDGTLVYSGLNYDGSRADAGLGEPNPLYPGSSDVLTGSQVYFAFSDDGGKTYPRMSFAGNGDDGAVFNDKQWFALQPAGDHAIVTWSQFYTTLPVGDPVPATVAGPLVQGTDYIVYSESFDAGRSWSPQRLFTPGTGLPVDAQFSMPQYLPGGDTVAVIWAMDDVDRLPGNPVATQRLSYVEGSIVPGVGTRFGPVLSGFDMHPVDSAPGRDGTGPSFFRVSTYPVLAVDASGGPHDGRRYVVWSDQPGPVDSDVELLLRWSDDGQSWSDPVTVNDVARGDQLMPWIDVDPLGGVHVAWYDRRNDPANEFLDVYYAYSADGGASFAPNVRVTERSFDGDLGHHQGGFPFIGDYIGLDADAHAAHLLWADTRHTGEPGREAGSDVYAATLVRDAESAAVFRR